jgi:ABC-type branched-subunit amino acid transport system permease subunit
MAYWTTSGEFVFVTILSGTGNIAAPFAGSILFELLRTYATQYVPYAWQLVVGTILLLLILFVPNGLWSLFSRRARRAA